MIASIRILDCVNKKDIEKDWVFVGIPDFRRIIPADVEDANCRK